MNNKIIEIGSFNGVLVNNSQESNIIGVVLYSSSNPFVIKVLKDNDFWNALHINSGPVFPIIAIQPKDGEYKTPMTKSNTLQYLIPVWEEPDENLKLLSELGITDTKELPMFLIYAKIKDENYCTVYSFKSNTIDNTYNELNEICSIINNTIQKFDIENLSNTDSLYRELTGSINYVFTWKKISSTFSLFNKIKSITGL